MKLLILGNSAFLPRKGISESDLPQNRDFAARGLIGSALEPVVKVAWPTDRLPGLVEEWLAETEPDAVLFIVNEFWFNYRSVPTLVSRRFGPLGRPIAAVGARAGRNRHLAYSRVFQRLRRSMEDRVGADAHFEPDQVIRVSTEVLRRIIRHEGAPPLAFFPLGGFAEQLPPAFRAEGARRCATVNAALQKFCEANRIEYIGPDDPLLANGRPKRSTLPDGVHSDAAGVATSVDFYGPRIFEFLARVEAGSARRGKDDRT